MEIKVKVFPNSSKARVRKIQDQLHVFVKSDKCHNMANQEAVDQVIKYFKYQYDQAKIIKGQRSQNKTMELK